MELDGLSIQDAAGLPLVGGVSLRVAPGEALVVIGETGSGKSLIAQALLGLVPAGFRVGGRLRLAGRAVALSDQAAVRLLWAHGTMLLPQDARAALDPTMRVGRQFATAGNAEAALAAVDLPREAARAYPFALSGGMAQRVLVATALGGSAPLVVVDEPTKGLDPARIGQVAASLRGLLAQGRSLIVITHDVALARALGGAVAVLREGRIVECRPAPALFARPQHAYTRDWLGADPSAWPAFPRAAPGVVGAGVVAAEAVAAEAVAEGQGLAFAYPGRPPLFSGIDLAVRRGGVLAVTGASGAGKSTLGDIVVGLLRPGAGRLRWQGADPADRRTRRRLRRSYQKLHQDAAAAFIPHRPVGRQLHDLAEVVPRLDPASALPPLLDRLALRPALLGRYPSELSGGEAQRLALVRLLLLDPVLIVADEPTSRLDPILQRETILLLREVARERAIGLLLISHNPALVAQTADEVVALG